MKPPGRGCRAFPAGAPRRWHCRFDGRHGAPAGRFRSREPAFAREDVAGGRAGFDWCNLDAVAGPDQLGATLFSHARDDVPRLAADIAHDHGNARLDDAGLLRRDLAQRRPEILLMIEVDRRDRGDATGWMTLVESSRPPRPTSTTATSTSARRNSSNAIAVVASKNVGGACSAPSARSASIAPRTSAAALRSAAASTGRPLITNRSARSIRCGDV